VSAAALKELIALKELTVLSVQHHDRPMGDLADARTNPLPQSFRFDGSDDALTTRSDREVIADGPTLPVGALLIVDRGPDAGSRFLLDQPVISVGRHRRSTIFLDDVTVSRRHAELRCTNGEVHIIDLGSLNGTYVNGEMVESALLVHGDKLQCGKFELTFWIPPAPTQPTTSSTCGSKASCPT
jgi:pSer/pThr/pTyr-binding forkhead associated (FHA) protein